MNGSLECRKRQGSHPKEMRMIMYQGGQVDYGGRVDYGGCKKSQYKAARNKQWCGGNECYRNHYFQSLLCYQILFRHLKLSNLSTWHIVRTGNLLVNNLVFSFLPPMILCHTITSLTVFKMTSLPYNKLNDCVQNDKGVRCVYYTLCRCVFDWISSRREDKLRRCALNWRNK